MIFDYNQYKQAQPAKMHLALPGNKIIKPLYGIEHARLKAHLNDIWQIDYEIDSIVDGEENPIFKRINQYMEIYVDNIGWFRIDETPQESYSDGRYIKTFVANGYETTLQDIDLNLFSINCGTDISIEMYNENINELGIPKHNIQLYIKNANNDPSSDKYWKLGLLNILEHEYLYKKGWTIGEIGIDIASMRGRQFEVSSKTVYAFLTQDAATAYKCMFQFDREKKKINAYAIKDIGKSLNIELSLRNVINTISITDQNDVLYNSFRVAGADEEQTILEYINFGSNRICNYNYFIETGMIPSSTAKKYRLYEEFKESKRKEYSDLSLRTLEINEKISAIEEQVPVDEVEVEYSNLTLEELNIELTSAKNVLTLLEEMHTIDGVLNIENTSDYAMYISFKEIIIPKIEAEIASREEGADEPEKIDWETNWELYGINELEVKRVGYVRSMEILEEKGYDKPWDSENPTEGVSEDFHNKQHELYLKYKNYVLEIDERLEKLKTEVDSLNKELKKISEERKALVDAVQMSNERWNFTQEELTLFNILTYETDFQDSTIEILDTYTLTEVIDLAWDLLDSAKEELEIESRPQMSFNIDLDNLFHIQEYMKKANNIEIGDFIFLELMNGFKTKQRLVTLDIELVNFNDISLNFEFSDSVTVYGKADDYRYLLENSSKSSSKNSISNSSSNKQFVSNIASTVAMQILKKYLNGSGGVGGDAFPFGISDNDLQKLVDALSGLIDGKISLEELKVELAKIDKLEANSAFMKYLNTQFLVANQGDFKELNALVAKIDSLLAGTISAETFHAINLMVENTTIDEAVIRDLIAAKITVGMLHAGDISANSFNIVSDDGGLLIAGNTMQFKDKNDIVRIQIGRDENDNFTFCLYDETGKGVLIDSTGIKESAISDGLIKNDMVGDGELGKEKMNFKVVNTDENGKVDIGEIVADGKGLSAKFITIEETFTEINSKIENSSSYSLQISTTHGRVFNRGIIESTAYVHLYRNGSDVTNEYGDECFIWKRESADSASDIYWNEQHSVGSKSLKITKADVLYGASFGCSFILNGKTITSI